jgi:tetratricopeptide (TPR) repeat protein
MNQPWSNTRYWLAACLAATAVGPVQLLRAETPQTTGEKLVAVRGAMVTEDAPVPYRLPLIGFCDPADEAQITGQVGEQASQAATVPPASLPFPASSTGLTAQLLPAVQRGYKLAQRGAFFAARTEFIQVLRRVAQAKDAAAGTDQFSVALAAGLRAMDEADDFVPQGAQLEGELDVRGVASAHRTPALREHTETILPHDAVALYHKFAQERLARAALDEQAGSMALYGLGKVYSRLAERQDDDVQCVRGALTMYSAALDACPNNNLAANELGVLLCRTGHPAQAVKSFTRAIDIAPTATAYHNLAVAQQTLNLQADASANEMESQRLAAMERATNTLSRQAGIQWVTPAELARVSQPAPLAPAAAEPAMATRPNKPPQHKWR